MDEGTTKMNVPHIKRKDIILLVFNNFNKIYGKTYIQKLFFIIKNELSVNNFKYDAHFYGPYSKELNEDVSELIKEGLIKESIQNSKDGSEYFIYSLTEDGKKYFEEVVSKNFDKKMREEIEKICASFSNFTPTQLLKYVYKIYPKSAENSIFFDA